MWQKDRRTRAAGSQRGGGESRAEADSSGLLCPGSCASEAPEFPGRGVSSRPHLLRGLTWALTARLATPRARLESPLHCRPLGRLGRVLGSPRPQGAAQAASRQLRAGRDPWGQGRKPEHPPALQTQLPRPGSGLYLLQNLQLCRPFHREFGSLSGASPAAKLVRNPPAVRETCVHSLGWEDPLEKGMATHSSILAWRIPRTVKPTGSQRVGHN